MKIGKECSFGGKAVEVGCFDNVVRSPDEGLFGLIDGVEVVAVASECS